MTVSKKFLIGENDHLQIVFLNKPFDFIQKILRRTCSMSVSIVQSSVDTKRAMPRTAAGAEYRHDPHNPHFLERPGTDIFFRIDQAVIRPGQPPDIRKGSSRTQETALPSRFRTNPGKSGISGLDRSASASSTTVSSASPTATASQRGCEHVSGTGRDETPAQTIGVSGLFSRIRLAIDKAWGTCGVIANID